MLPEIVTGGASVLGNIVGGVMNYFTQRSTNKANMELAKYKYDKDLEMWNRQNDYNSPAAQMSRYAQAGINPNIISGQASNGNASGMPEFNAPEMKGYTGWNDLGMSDWSQQILNKYRLDNETRQTDSNVRLNQTMENKNNAGAALDNVKAKTEYYNA